MPDTPRRKLKIDFKELVLALEGFGGEAMEHFLDTETGEIIPLHDDFDDTEEIRERIDADVGERYQTIEQSSTRTRASASWKTSRPRCRSRR